MYNVNVNAGEITYSSAAFEKSKKGQSIKINKYYY